MPLVALINGERSLATPAGPRRAVCPGCNAEMLAKTGDVVTHHWAHRYESDTPRCQHEPETPWHLGWKARRADSADVEVTQGTRRADVLTPYKWAVEFQHSPLSVAEVRARESDWRQRMIWAFDCLEAADGMRLEYWRPPGRNHHTLRWAWSKSYVIAARTPTFLHVDESTLVLVGKWFEKTPGRPIMGYGWQLSADEFAKHVINGARPPQPPRFGEPLYPSVWSEHVVPRVDAGHDDAVTALAGAQPSAVLDWSDPRHWNRGKHVACRLCGWPTLLLDDAGRPAHKTCVESALGTIAEAA